MSTELRRSKRKAATEPDDEPAPATKKVLKVAAKAKKTATDTSSSKNNDKFKSDRTIKLDDFASQEIETHEGVKTTLKAMVEGSKSGVAIFTYPKASTPGCTTQARLFGEDYAHLTSTGLSIYGLSKDPPSANTKFKTKLSLPYTLLCDRGSALISAIGLEKELSKTRRGVFVVDKQGKVLIEGPGGPAETVEAVSKLVDSLGGPAKKL